eukprot:c14224_g1_i1.p1 GENE.c14224_g1_i1~~c14224_g1_i1.p1  ORF type:complete len:364 (+),score=91.02 c14224_g1_i1:111-1202(+)
MRAWGVVLFACVLQWIVLDASPVPEPVVPTEYLTDLPSPIDARVSPDYVEGPWFKMDSDHPFVMSTARPNVSKIIELLGQIEENTREATKLAVAFRKEKLPEETELLSVARKNVESLTADVTHAKELQELTEQIPKMQAEADNILHFEIVPLLERLSQRYDTDARVRLPYADRLAQFTQDLQEIHRARDDVACKLRGHLSGDRLASSLQKFTDIATEIQKKIDDEVASAESILGPNKAEITTTKESLKDAEGKLRALQEKIRSAVGTTQGFNPSELTLKQLSLDNQQHALNALTRAGKAQDDVIQHLKEDEDDQMAVVNHALVILEAMLQPDTQPEQRADTPPAVQLRPNPAPQDCTPGVASC